MQKLKVIVFTFLITVLVVSTHAQVDSVSSYSLVTYGLPTTLAGYKVLAVKTSENTACMSKGRKRLILQTTDQDVETFLKNSHPLSVRSELSQFVGSALICPQ